MPVFDTAAAFRASRPAGYLEKKALRASTAATQAQADLMNKQIEQYDTEVGIEQQKANTAASRASLDWQKFWAEGDEKEKQAMMDSFAAYSAAYQKSEDIGKASEAFYDALSLHSPEVAQEMRDRQLLIQPEFADAALMTQDEWLNRTRPQNIGQASFIGDDGQPHKGKFDGEFYRDAAGNIHLNAQPIAPSATQSELDKYGGGPGDKTSDRKTREVVVGAENLLSSIDRISTQISEMDQAALGLPGKVSSIIDNASSAIIGFAELLGGVAQINGEVVPESALLDVRLYSDFFVEAAVENAALQANAVGLAYALARSANPDGRISDADVRHQLKRVKLDQSSKPQMLGAIKEVRREVLANVSNHLRVYRYTDTKEGKNAYDKYMKELDEMSAVPPDDEDKVVYDDGTEVVFK